MIPHNKLVLRPEDHAAVRRVLDSGHIAQGREVEAFEEELAERFRPNGAAACVSSGTAALYLALSESGIRGFGETDADIVCAPTYACSSIANAIWKAGAKLALFDCAKDSTKTEYKLESRHDAVIHVPMYGYRSDFSWKKRDTPGGRRLVIEDFTHCPGGFAAGRLGHVSVISFGATKPLGCGAGGAVLGSKDLIERVKAARDYDDHQSNPNAFHWSISDLHAAIGRERLKHLDEDDAFRRETAELYSQMVPPESILDGNTLGHMRYRFVLLVDAPDWAIMQLAERGVKAINPLRTDELLHRNRPYGVDFRSPYQNAEDLAARTISVPTWPGMSSSELDTVAEALKWLF